ncbi:MAG: methylmalonyl Co-A mutase-associated GTPase MeaB [Melioribacteraceae bacterium]|nr:methylmalonyl Co-A mutase-associated GTPase MeaB [Melioribacteraceae bacterium]
MINLVELSEKIFIKDKRSISKAITIIESEEKNAIDLLKLIHNKTGNAYKIGITGPPGAGKSTLTNAITKFLLIQNKSVGIIAVDPTSPFTGGALLGDRVRMNEIGVNPKVFIRSMATRGSLGGLSKKTIDASEILDAAGFDFIIFETVGVGQSELDIVNAADTTIVVLVPESGDAIQAMKAGLMEIADLFVLNKSDRPGADSALMALKTILMLKNHTDEDWLPNIVKAVASENNGIEEIINEIYKHKNFLIEKNILNRKRANQLKIRIKEIVETFLRYDLWNEENLTELNKYLLNHFEKTISPYEVAEKLIINFKENLKSKYD